MLNPSFPKSSITFNDKSYVAPKGIAEQTLEGNMSIDDGDELRLQDVYGEEIWLKLQKAGISPNSFTSLSVLEVCGGGGFLTYHLLKRAIPLKLTVNDISPNELIKSKHLLSTHFPMVPIEFILGDMHQAIFDQKFDLIIGNSFLHHFHDVPGIFSRFFSLLNEGGSFISLHEPTPMSTVVESAKILAYPVAIFAPGFVNEIARYKFKGAPSNTDIWMFEPSGLKKIAESSGFKVVRLYPWHLLRSLVAQKFNLHLSVEKSNLNNREVGLLRHAFKLDSILNRFLPNRFFGSFCIVCKK